MNWNKLLISFIIYTLLIINGNLAKNVQKRGVMDNLNDGLKIAGQMFGKEDIESKLNRIKNLK